MDNKNHISDPNTRMVSGPVNIMRLEGTINGIKKVIYLFMDYHMNVNSQTQCENVFSDDVQKYFIKNFYKLNRGSKMYDFFVEINPSELAEVTHKKGVLHKDYKEKYIEEIVKFFRKIFRYDSKKNKVSVNKYFKNIRLHYLDIRDYYKHNIQSKVYEMSNIAHSFMRTDDIDINGLEQIIRSMQVLRDHLEFIIRILSKTHHKSKISKSKIIKDNSRGAIDVQALEYLASKMKTSYSNDYVKKIMNMLIDTTIENFEQTIKDIDDATTEFSEYANNIYGASNKLVKDENTSYLYSYGLSANTIRQMIVNITNKVEILIDEKFIEFFARFTDIYFLRRFLDKKYITNAITYTGALHSNTYVYVLVKFFNFKITHASYSKITDMTKLTAEVKKRSLMEIQELILPDVFHQCSDMKQFPADFL